MAASLVAVAATAGCTATAGDPSATTSASASSAGPALTWTRVSLPAGVGVRTLTTMGDRLLVGGLAAGSPPAPVMVTVDGSGAPTSVPLTPTSGYAFEARWYSVATDGTRIIAIGGANGGAHSNVRWTTWAGSSAGVRELPQNFYTFGGWGAGDLVDAVITPSGDALVGSWGGAKAGLDVAVWTAAGDVWTRQDPAGTALESTGDLLVGPRAAAADDTGVLVAGSALHLAPGSVGQLAALWRSSTLNQGWHRIDLPEAGRHSEATSVRCAGASPTCIVLGQVDGSLAAWTLDDDTARRDTGIPALPLDEKAVVLAPLATGAAVTVVSPSAGRTAVLTRANSGWRTSSGPDGTPTAAAQVGNRLYVSTQTSTDGATALWVATVPT